MAIAVQRYAFPQTFIARIYNACRPIGNLFPARQPPRFSRQSLYVAVGETAYDRRGLTTRVIFHASLDNYAFRWIVELSVVEPCNGDYGQQYPFPVNTIVPVA